MLPFSCPKKSFSSQQKYFNLMEIIQIIYISVRTVVWLPLPTLNLTQTLTKTPTLTGGQFSSGVNCRNTRNYHPGICFKVKFYHLRVAFKNVSLIFERFFWPFCLPSNYAPPKCYSTQLSCA